MRKRRRGGLGLSRNARIVVYTLTGVAVAVAAFLGVSGVLERDSLLETRDTGADQSLADTLPGFRPDADPAANEPELSDVARERAALDNPIED